MKFEQIKFYSTIDKTLQICFYWNNSGNNFWFVLVVMYKQFLNTNKSL